MLDNWNILQKEKVRGILRLVTERLRRVETEVFGRRYGWAPVARRICDGAYTTTTKPFVPSKLG
jgi:hypothetical protein